MAETTTVNPVEFEMDEWVALPTKQHLDGDDVDLLGTGPDGWGLYLEGDEGEGYFAWLHHEPEAKHIVDQHNAAIRRLTDVEDELERLTKVAQQVDDLRRMGGVTFTTSRAQQVFDDLWGVLAGEVTA